MSTITATATNATNSTLSTSSTSTHDVINAAEMKKLPLCKAYEGKKFIAEHCLSNFGGLVILDIIYDCGDTLYVVAWDFGEGLENVHRHKEQMSSSGRGFITKGKRRWYLDEFERIA